MYIFAANFPEPSYISKGAIVNSFTLRPDGTLTEEARRRADGAIGLYHAGETERLLMTGSADERDFPYLSALGTTQSEAFARYARESGVPESDILIDPVQLMFPKLDTLGALFRWWLIGPRRLHVATSDYHLGRVARIFDFIRGGNGEVEYLGVPTHDLESPEEAGLRDLLAASEPGKIDLFGRFWEGVMPGDIRAIGDRLNLHHPYYNNGSRVRINDHAY